MRTALTWLVLACAAPLAAQSSADTAAIRAAALRESPPADTARHEITELVIRRDTAVVTVFLERGYSFERRHRLTLVRDRTRWVALPARALLVVRFARSR